MATTKNALLRYRVLDKCFRNIGKKYFIDDLIEECNKMLEEKDEDASGVSRRQIFDDIAFMESSSGWNIDLERIKEGRKVYYKYADASFSINNSPVTDVELHQLKSAVNILTHFKGLPQFDWMDELTTKLSDGLRLKHNKQPIISFDSNQYLRGVEHLGILYNAILYKRVLKITYQPFTEQVAEILTIHPYFLKQYNNRWFLFGRNPKTEKYDWNLALDRIKNITEANISFIENEVIDWDTYFDDFIGVTKPVEATPDKVVLHFLGKTGKYIETKPIHGSQKAKWLSDNTLEVKLHLIVNYEFSQLLLSFAENVKVIEPIGLARTIQERLLAAIKNYQ